MEVVIYQVGIGFDFQPILVYHYIDNEKEVKKCFPKVNNKLCKKVYQKTKHFMNKSNLYRNRRG